MQIDGRPAKSSGSEDHAGRRRRIGGAAVGVAVALALVGGVLLSRRAPDQATTQRTAARTVPAALPPAVSAISWNAALVARDDTTITVYASIGDVPCKELVGPQATVTEQTDTQVVVVVRGQIVDATDCSTSGTRAPLVVSLQKPLGNRLLRDAAGALPPPALSERELPDLASGRKWSPHSTHCDDGWCQGYNGPNGSTLLASAGRTVGRESPAAVGTVAIGSHEGVITGRADRFWQVRWNVGDVTYSLMLTPTEGATFSLKQFRAELASLKWK
ncbi:hypothetical protein LADH09A_004460 [Micromonospora sp. LAH09]|uniref:hypothetical protein n=1 Tax=Micromonospora cabrerizensis TaxID=2911213 RepID=UPI001EE7F4D1|nr:hypothetical protein [Micromonospora cabrerizensis]MCG5470510.1 hypothetical protein [Micromonospora cabrerizensis]